MIKKGIINLHFFAFLLIISISFIIASCEKKTQQVFPASNIVAKKPLKTTKVHDLQQRLNLLLTPLEYRYKPVGKPDPFLPFIRPSLTLAKDRKEEKGPPERCATALECINVGQLHIVGIITSLEGEKIAMAQDAATTGYYLKKGTKVGYHKGFVKDILPDRVIISEETEDLRGNIVMTERVLLLHMEEQNEGK